MKQKLSISTNQIIKPEKIDQIIMNQKSGGRLSSSCQKCTHHLYFTACALNYLSALPCISGGMVTLAVKFQQETDAHKEHTTPPLRPLTFKEKPQSCACVCTCNQTEKDIASVHTGLNFSTSFVSCVSADCFHITHGLAMQYEMRGLGILGLLHWLFLMPAIAQNE